MLNKTAKLMTISIILCVVLLVSPTLSVLAYTEIPELELPEKTTTIGESDIQQVNPDTTGINYNETAINDGQRHVDETEKGDAIAYSLDNSTFSEYPQEISLTASADFTSIVTQSKLRSMGNYASTDYFILQGGCSDGTYYYYAFSVKNQDKEPIDTCIIWGTLGDGGVFSVTSTSIMTGLMSKLQHANDLTYNEDTGEIVIVCCETGYHNMIYTIPASKLRSNTKNLTRHYVSCAVTAMDYNPTRAQYVVALSGKNNAFAILDNNFQMVKTVGYSTEIGSNWVSQGIYTDNAYIYRLHYWETENNGNNIIENRLRIFDWDGHFVHTIEFKVDKGGEARIYECENLFVAKDRLMIGFVRRVSKTDRTFTYVDLSDYMFHAQFCPDENVSEYKYVYNNGNVQAMMFYGLTTPLRKFRVQVEGKKFTGWTAYRVEQNKWYYRNADDTDRSWYKEGSQPSGYTKFIYKDKANVSKTGAKGGHVLLCAQWESTSKYTVSFMKNGATGGTMSDQNITYGTSTALRTNTYTKNNRTFQFWNAYWSEKNKWYYQSADGSTKGWYKEGYEPAGYKKYVYNDKQSVSKTVKKGSHVYMYAVWNEYYIQYDANVATISYGNILEQDTAIYASGAKNYVDVFKTSTRYFGASTSSKYNVSGYRLYRREIDKWMYINASGTKNWYAEGEQPSGYSLYVRQNDGNVYLGATALPGEHLVLYAMWEIA